VRLRWCGVYEQKPKAGNFMLRVKIPGGELNSMQMRVLADVAGGCGGFADITTRQDFQFHWLTVERLPEAMRRLDQVGLTTLGACGDITRNVTGCPAAGVDPHELLDSRRFVRAVTDFFLGNRSFSNLPRKFKISVSGCPLGCVLPQINDIGAVAVRRERPGGAGEVGFRIWVGGGLSSMPMFAQPLRMFAPADRLVDVCRVIAEIFRDHGNRQKRHRARLKFLVAEWGLEEFERQVRLRLGWTPDDLPPEEPLRELSLDHVGVHQQRDEGLCWVGVPVLSGRLTAQQMWEVSRLADEFGSGRIRTTAQQNLLILDVPAGSVEPLTARLASIGLPVDRTDLRAGATACTGTEFCNLAITETKGLLADVVRHLETSVRLDAPIRIGMSGCPSGCAQHMVADIGLQGCLVPTGNGKMEGFDVFVGGSVSLRRFARPVWRKLCAEKVPYALEHLLKAYLEARRPSETFAGFCARHTAEQLSRMLGVGG
ncbi:MAG: nitrite/sulfite reductase, partial [Armatimonadota bacterium]